MDRVIVCSQHAPAAIGCYSQAVKVGDTVYLSGQIPLDPVSKELIEGPIENKMAQVFKNLQAVAESAGGSLNDIVKLTVYLTDMAHFQAVNNAMIGFFQKPYPARAVIGVASLPKGAEVEADAVMVLRES